MENSATVRRWRVWSSREPLSGGGKQAANVVSLLVRMWNATVSEPRLSRSQGMETPYAYDKLAFTTEAPQLDRMGAIQERRSNAPRVRTIQAAL